MNINDFFEAIYTENIDAVRHGIEDFGLDPNFTHMEGGHTPLQAACEIDSLCMVRFLLEKGADANKKLTRVDIGGRAIEVGATALASAKSPNVAACLIESGAKPDLADDMGYTPLVRVALRRDIKVFKYLVENGANFWDDVNLGDKSYSIGEIIDSKINSVKKATEHRTNTKRELYFGELEAIKQYWERAMTDRR